LRETFHPEIFRETFHEKFHSVNWPLDTMFLTRIDEGQRNMHRSVFLIKMNETLQCWLDTQQDDLGANYWVQTGTAWVQTALLPL
jgi:hypothetical protein